MRIAFMGTPDFAVHALAALVEAGYSPVCVYSQPPAPRGRGQQLTPSPVHAYAESRGIPVRTPRSMKTREAIDDFKALDLDVALVVAYGQILVREVLEAPRLGCFNLHGSLLPRWRGAAPIQRAIMAGDPVTGVEVMRMSEGLDEGAVLSTARVEIEADDTAGSLHDKMAAAGARLLAATLPDILAGRAVETPQAAEGVTYAKKIKTEEARIDWSRPAIEVDRQIRGLSPFPGAWFQLDTPKGPVRVKALGSRLALGDGAPGEALDDELRIACGTGAVRLTRLQREGRGAQDAEVFLNGQPVPAGAHLA
ncbi:MAG: methionyl-tRNA formyltransferase [Pseudomonadota bacterium]|jgi:methionyl-tRNA formyltransferase